MATEREAAAGFLSNPLVQWGLAIAGVYLLSKWLLPAIYSGGKKAVMTAGTDLIGGIGGIFNGLGDIIGMPQDQSPNRSMRDEIAGTFSASKGDRTLSDLVDAITFAK